MATLWIMIPLQLRLQHKYNVVFHVSYKIFLLIREKHMQLMFDGDLNYNKYCSHFGQAESRLLHWEKTKGIL